MATMSNVTTADELLVLHEPGFRHELVRGQLARMSPAGWWHGAVAAWLARVLLEHVEQTGAGTVFGAETGFLLARDPDTVRAPDAAFVARRHSPTSPGPGYFPGAPDLAVEVTSPGDTFTAVHEKALCWLEHGARLVWVVDPDARRVTVYRSATDVRVLSAGDTLAGDEVLPGFAQPVDALSPSLQPPRPR